MLRSAGPQGAPGIPESSQLPIPNTLRGYGVTGVVRISDAQMSGTAYGKCVLHVSPEAAVDAPPRTSLARGASLRI